jgi:hypothetical protein
MFTDKTHLPNEKVIESALGKKMAFLKRILSENNIDESIWKFYGKTSGWTLKCRIGKKNIFYIQIVLSSLYVWFTVGRKTKEKLMGSTISQKLKENILSAKEYIEGTSFKVEVLSELDIMDIKLLVSFKTE